MNKIKFTCMECGHSREIESMDMDENWRVLLSEYEHLIGRKYRFEHDERIYTFFGLIYAEDDFYYCMIDKDGKTELLSCVGDIEDFDMELIDE